MGPGILGQHAPQGFPAVLRHFFQQLGGNDDLQRFPRRDSGEAPQGFRVAVGVGNVGLDVQNGRSVHQIGAQDPQHGAPVRRPLHSRQLYAGEGNGVGPEGRAGGEHAHPGVSAQPGRADGGGPVLPHRLVEDPHQPDVGKALQPPKGVLILKFGLKHNGGLQSVYQPALPGNAEFCGKIAVDAGDGPHGEFLRHTAPRFS